MLFAAFTLFHRVLGTTLSFAELSDPEDASTMVAFAILMFATNRLISTQHRLQMTIRMIVLVETFAEHLDVQAVLHLSLAAAAGSVV